MVSLQKIHIRRQEARSRMFVTTVSYPVQINGTFMGVAAVNIPLTEISQLAAPMMVRNRENTNYILNKRLIIDWRTIILFYA